MRTRVLHLSSNESLEPVPQTEAITLCRMRARRGAGVWADSWPAIPVARGTAMLVKNVRRSIGCKYTTLEGTVLRGQVAVGSRFAYARKFRFVRHGTRLQSWLEETDYAENHRCCRSASHKCRVPRAAGRHHSRND